MPFDENRAYRDRRQKNETNWPALLLVIFIAVTAGNLTSNWIEKQLLAHELRKIEQEFAKQLKAETEKAQQAATQAQIRNAQIARENQKRQKQQQIAEENRQATRRKQIETCQFWIKEYGKTRKEVDMHHRNNACRDAGIGIN